MTKPFRKKCTSNSEDATSFINNKVKRMKKKKFFILPILYCCIAVQAQTSSKNYLLEKQMLDVSDNQIQSISDKAGSLLYDGSFDFKDGTNTNKHKRISYVVTPNGSLQKYDPQTRKIKVLSNDMPSDSNDSDRLNENNINYISIEKTIVQKIDVNNFSYQIF